MKGLLFALPFLIIFTLSAVEFPADIACGGNYSKHLQGVCIDEEGSIVWSFTTNLVKTNTNGDVIHSIEVPDHHGDLCFHEGKIFVAVNLGEFNRPDGKADSWIYVYDSKTLQFLSKHEIQEVFHGAGGMAMKDGNFFVVGGLPNGIKENYVYEYDANFSFIEKHIIPSGWTHLGIQTATFHDGSWWFGCYGTPKILLKTGPNFENPERYEFDCSLGIVGVGKGNFLVAKGPKTKEKRCLGTLHPAAPNKTNGLQFTMP